MSKRKYKNKAEAEEDLTNTYVGKVIRVIYVDHYRKVTDSKTDKLDRLSIDHRNHINMFFVDDVMISLHKDVFFNQVELLN